MKTLLCCALLALVGASAGCSTYRSDYSYDPAPAVSANAPPRVMSAVYGVLRGDDADPAGVDLRVRVEAGDATVELVRDGISLVTGDLVPLELVKVEPQGGMLAPAGGAGTWRLVFAFPPGRDLGDLDLAGLAFSWQLRIGDDTQRGTATFRKVFEPVWIAPAYYGPWWHGPWGYGPSGWYWY